MKSYRYLRKLFSLTSCSDVFTKAALSPQLFEDKSEWNPQPLPHRVRGLAPVVQKVDNDIHRINHYPLDSAIDFAIIYPLDSAIHCLNNWGSSFYPLIYSPIAKHTRAINKRKKADPLKKVRTEKTKLTRHLAPVVQTMDSASRRINHYPVDKS